ncbi:MAG: molybdopterin-guanine dinucleotide biosynthesis protein B [Candidatus Puniceispirillaceae bacterium]
MAKSSPSPFVFGFAGWSGSGKTTLAEKLIRLANNQGISISTIKHAHHHFDADIEGKDSWRHRKAGASQVLVASERRSALFTENAIAQKPVLSDLLSRLDHTDWVLVEGFKEGAIPKIEIFMPHLSKTPLYQTDKHIIAVMSEAPVIDCPLPWFHRDDVSALFTFLQQIAQR